MRYATFSIVAETGFTGVGRTISSHPDITHEGIQNITLLGDGTVLMLTRLRGDLERARTILEERDDIRHCEVFGTDEGYAYIHAEATDVVRQLLTVEREHEVLISTPIEFAESEGADGEELRVTLLGDDRTLQRVVSNAPDAVDIRLEETGEYQPNLDEVAALLTERQREILGTAVEMGYYEVPRGTTQREVADALGLAPGTVTEHLQKIESKVLTPLVQ
ncbi:helix-turn-helix domain-containing protein [Halorientalis salina]|uniref:helix-turn-helix domain-containing protein n=1 Tax=Halorientalis salina TaxID=2932266 RepID=UPI0010AC6924|nr:helix-turn-helix domain-containing protein [Halorientalis salina]